MEQNEAFHFLKRQEFEKLTVAEKVAYIDGATEELRRRGEKLRSFTQLVANRASPSEPHEVRSRLADDE